MILRIKRKGKRYRVISDSYAGNMVLGFFLSSPSCFNNLFSDCCESGIDEQNTG